MIVSRRVCHVPPSSTLLLAEKAKQLKAEGIDIISLTIGEPDFDTPAHIKRAAVEALEQGFTKYTHPEGIADLRKAVTNRIFEDLGLTYDWQNTIITNGSKQGIFNFFQAALNSGDEVIVPSPYWVSYPPMIQLAQGIPKIVQTTQEEGFKLDSKKLKKAITRRTKAIVINSPSNPTGAVYTREELGELASVLEGKPIWIVSDDAYSKIIFDGLKFVSMAGLSKKLFSKTVIFNTCSKTYAMTGWRVGFVTGADDRLMRAMGVLQSQSTSGVNAMAQKAAIAALTTFQDGVLAMVKEFDRRRQVGLEGFSLIKEANCFRPEGAFYFFADFSNYYRRSYKGNRIKNSDDLCTFLLEEARVAAIPGKEFGSDKHLRFSFAASEENIRQAMIRVQETLEKLKK